MCAAGLRPSEGCSRQFDIGECRQKSCSQFCLTEEYRHGLPQSVWETLKRLYNVQMELFRGPKCLFYAVEVTLLHRRIGYRRSLSRD